MICRSSVGELSKAFMGQFRQCGERQSGWRVCELSKGLDSVVEMSILRVSDVCDMSKP